MPATSDRPLNPDPFLTVAACADYLNVSEPTVRRAVDRGDLPVTRFGTAVRIRLSALIAYADGASK